MDKEKLLIMIEKSINHDHDYWLGFLRGFYLTGNLTANDYHFLLKKINSYK